MDLNKLTMDEKIEEAVIERFLLKEKEYMRIAEQNVINIFNKFKGSSENRYMEIMIRAIIIQYNNELLTIKRKIKDKVIVETLYPEEMKETSLKRFPPYI